MQICSPKRRCSSRKWQSYCLLRFSQGKVYFHDNTLNFYQKGKCHRGDSCKFIHPENPNIKAQLEMNGRNAQFHRKMSRNLVMNQSPMPTGYVSSITNQLSVGLSKHKLCSKELVSGLRLTIFAPNQGLEKSSQSPEISLIRSISSKITVF